jgi:hypothetical protein
MSGSREHEHVIAMRRPSPGIHWLVTHLESMTQLLAITMHGKPPLAGSACRRLLRARCPARVPGRLREPIFYSSADSSTNTDRR